MSQEILPDIADNEIAIQPKKPAAEEPAPAATNVTPAIGQAEGEAEAAGITATEEAKDDDDEDDDDTPATHAFKPRGKTGGGASGAKTKPPAR